MELSTGRYANKPHRPSLLGVWLSDALPSRSHTFTCRLCCIHKQHWRARWRSVWCIFSLDGQQVVKACGPSISSWCMSNIRSASLQHKGMFRQWILMQIPRQNPFEIHIPLISMGNCEQWSRFFHCGFEIRDTDMSLLWHWTLGGFHIGQPRHGLA